MTVAEFPSPAPRQLDGLERQAHDWVRRLTSGTARQEDVEALRRWCATSTAHQQAFNKAHRLWRELLPAAQRAAARDPGMAMLRNGLEPPRQWSRRAFLGGAVAAAAVAGVAWVQAPLIDLSLDGASQADYRTAVGEQRQVALAAAVTVDLNTRSHVAVRSAGTDRLDIELFDGEIAIETGGDETPVTVTAGPGRLHATQAQFEVRYLDGSACVTCFAGRLEVTHAGRETALGPRMQLLYDKSAMQPPRSIDSSALPAWRSGVLSFHDTALSQVVAEINRYRPGRVVVVGAGLDSKPVSGRFQIRDLDKAIAQIQRLFRLEATSLPGGVVILS